MKQYILCKSALFRPTDLGFLDASCLYWILSGGTLFRMLVVKHYHFQSILKLFTTFCWSNTYNPVKMH